MRRAAGTLSALSCTRPALSGTLSLAGTLSALSCARPGAAAGRRAPRGWMRRPAGSLSALSGTLSALSGALSALSFWSHGPSGGTSQTIGRARRVGAR